MVCTFFLSVNGEYETIFYRVEEGIKGTVSLD
jgi:hypothetical protein